MGCWGASEEAHIGCPVSRTQIIQTNPDRFRVPIGISWRYDLHTKNTQIFNLQFNEWQVHTLLSPRPQSAMFLYSRNFFSAPCTDSHCYNFRCHDWFCCSRVLHKSNPTLSCACWSRLLHWSVICPFQLLSLLWGCVTKCGLVSMPGYSEQGICECKFVFILFHFFWVSIREWEFWASDGNVKRWMFPIPFFLSPPPTSPILSQPIGYHFIGERRGWRGHFFQRKNEWLLVTSWSLEGTTDSSHSASIAKR